MWEGEGRKVGKEGEDRREGGKERGRGGREGGRRKKDFQMGADKLWDMQESSWEVVIIQERGVAWASVLAGKP